MATHEPIRGVPLSPAERQRRHRAKRKAEAQAERDRMAPGSVMAVMAENTVLRNRLEAALRNAAEARNLRAQRDAVQERFSELRPVLRQLFARLSPAARTVARKHLQETGFVEWLDAD